MWSKAIAFLLYLVGHLFALLMLLRSGTFLLLFSCAYSLYAQQDSIMLKPVTIYGLPEQKYLEGSAFNDIDSSLQKSYTSNHLGEALAIQFPVYFRNYGNGMISGISMRGTSPQHTAVLWNGININSFSLGQADFSILPMVAFDEIKVHAGGGSARFGSGAFGGTVMLNSSFPEKSNLFSAKQEVGSFGRYFTSAKMIFENGPVSSSTSVYRLQSQNDFKINRTNERQQHASFTQQGIVQDIAYTIAPNKSIRLHYWYHDAAREIQPSIGKYNSTDEQQDRNHRLSVSYQQNAAWGKLKTGGGIVDDVIVFNGNKTEVLRWIAFTNHQYTIAKQWHLQFSTDWNHIIGKIKEYGRQPVEDRIDVAASVQRNINKHSLSFNLRQPFISQVTAPLLPYLGASVMLLNQSGHQLMLSTNVSKNFRAPTFNDRYWQNLGRQNLKPETTHAAEAGLTWKNGLQEFSSRGFYQMVDQWIQWTPDAGGVYRPENIKQVEARGVEATAAAQWSAGLFVFRSKASYQYTRSTASKAAFVEAATIGKQLIYTPLHTGNAFASVKLNEWHFTVFMQYSGKRFTEASNAEVYALPAYFLCDASLERSLPVKRSIFGVQFAVRNVFNEIYQQYAGRAMPGRYFNLQLSYQLKSNKV